METRTCVYGDEGATFGIRCQRCGKFVRKPDEAYVKEGVDGPHARGWCASCGPVMLEFLGYYEPEATNGD